MLKQFTHINIEPELRDLWWSNKGGSIEQKFRAPGTTAILLDLSKLIWADPLPLLMLACLSAEFRGRGGELEIELGQPFDGNHQFNLFFAQHGFLAAIGAETLVRWDGDIFPPDKHVELDQRLRGLTGALAYRDAECIPAQIFPTDGLNSQQLDQLVENLVEIAHPRISSWLPGNSRRRGLMSHQLRVFLSEALDNVHEHAYRSTIGYGAVYARIRAGWPEEPGARRAWFDARSRENVNCPTLVHFQAGRRPGWLELFVCDIGVGLSHDFPDDKSPLQKLSYSLFREPISRVADRPSVGKTNMTGLQRIGQLLLAGSDRNNRGNFVRIYTNGEWVGEHLPWPKRGLHPGHFNYNMFKEAVPPMGTALHFTLEPPPASANEQAALYPSAFYQPTYDDLSNVRAELAFDRARDCHDVALFDVYRAPDQSISRDLTELRSGQPLSAPTVMVRPSRGQRKSDLVNQIRLLLTDAIGVKDVAFIDVPWSAAIDFYNIIVAESNWLKASQTSSLRVHILSQDWFCATLIFNQKMRRFRRSTRQAQAFSVGSFARASAAQAAAILRRQDSILFWQKANQAYFNEPIRWRAGASDDEGQIIWGYLDLNFALARPAIHEIARRAVRRSISSFATHSIHATDDLIIRLLESDFELNEPYPSMQPWPERMVLAGSVLGSGTTVQRFMRGAPVPYKGALQLLRHPDFAKGEMNELLALDWLPRKPQQSSSKVLLERVANTPFVIRGGESAVPLARFSETAMDGQNRLSLYGENPDDAYRRWQRRDLLRLGHWTYGANHDLLTLRLADALVYDAAEGGTLVGWLAEQLREWIIDEHGNPNGFVVYAQHEVTSQLARTLAEHSLCKGISFFPAAAASSRGKAALLLSPMTREAMIAICQNRLIKGGVAVILDDAIVTGQTMRILRQAVHGLWEGMRIRKRVELHARLKIRTLAIVDRSGEPAQRALVERNLPRHRRFWRWDVPSLGHAGTCVLCGLHGRWQALRSAIHGNLLRERLDQWLKQWAATPVAEGRFDAGVPARRLPMQSTTRFGIERNRNAHLVHHSQSVSRVSLAAEIAGATTRKDYPLRKAREALTQPDQIDSETALEILTTQLLLFQDDLSPADKVERLELLLELLWSRPEATISTALAGMTMLIDQSLVDGTWKACIRLIEERGFTNLDTILVALALYHMAGSAFPPPLRIGASWEVFDLCRRSSADTRHALAMILRVFGWSPNSVHRAALPDRLKNHSASDSELEQTILLLERLADAFHGLPLFAVEGSLIRPNDDSKFVKDMAEKLSFTLGGKTSADGKQLPAPESAQTKRALLDECWTKLFSKDGLHLEYRRQLCASLTGYDGASKVLIPAWRIVESRWPNFVREKGEDVSTNWPEDPLTFFENADGAHKAVDLYFDGTVRCAVADLMSNVVHRTHKIQCPWPEGSEIPEADLWGRVTVASDSASAVIELVNGLSVPRDAQPHMTPNLAHLLAIGGKWTTEPDVERKLIRTKIYLPTAAGLAGS